MDPISDLPLFGFIGVDGQPVAVPTRRSYWLPYVQDALKKARGTRVKCLCGYGSHLIPFEVAGYHGEVCDVRRESVQDRHGKGCPATELGLLIDRPPVVFTTGAFGPPTDADANPADGNAPGARPKVRHGSFTLFAHRHFGRASMRAIKLANSGKTYRDRTLRPFTVKELHAAIRHGLENAKFSRGEPLVATLASQHREIIWGVTMAPLGEMLADAAALKRDVQVLLKGVHTVGREAPSKRLVRIPLNVAARAGGRRIGFSELIPPPYFYFITVDLRPMAEGRRDVFVATRVVVFPIAGVDAIFAVESGFERDVVLKYHGLGFAFLKMGVHYELGELGAGLWPFRLLANGRLPHRPDLIVFSKARCWVVELAGLEGKPGYLELVERRLAAMTGVAAHEDVKPFRILRRKFLTEQAAGSSSAVS